MPAKPHSPDKLRPNIRLPAEQGPTDAFPPDEDVSIPPPGSDQTVGALDPEAEREGRPRKKASP
jgi:hypothetical protein